jgi:hypothetical protein
MRAEPQPERHHVPGVLDVAPCRDLVAPCRLALFVSAGVPGRGDAPNIWAKKVLRAYSLWNANADTGSARATLPCLACTSRIDSSIGRMRMG